MQGSSPKVVPPRRSGLVNLLIRPLERRHPKARAGVRLVPAIWLTVLGALLCWGGVWWGDADDDPGSAPAPARLRALAEPSELAG